MSERDPRTTYWRSLHELEPSAEFEEFVSREFPHTAAPDVTSEGRRRFVQLLGASLALAGAGCRYPQDKLVPQTRKPSDLIPGVPKRFATAMDFAGGAVGLQVTSYDGRPIKIEGNPDHPESLGAALQFQQASILELYDPDRQRKVTFKEGERETEASWDEFVRRTADVFRKHRQNQGRGLRILAEGTSSPTLARLKGRFLNANPEAKWVEWEPVSRDNEIAGARLAFGRPVRTQLRLERADVILTLADDLFVERPDSIRLNKEFSRRRVAGDKGEKEPRKVSRLYAVESRFSTSGAKADHRLPLRAEQIKPFLVALDARLGGRQAEVPQGSFLRQEHVAKFLDALAEDLNANKGRAVVTVGRGQPAEVHALAHRVNATLNAPGATVVYTEEPAPADTYAALKGLVREMAAGDVTTLVVLGGNPVYSAPADLDFARALGKVGTTISLSGFRDETALLCNWRLPKAHYLETWGDARGFDGTVSIVQPLIDPLYKDSKSPLEFALHLLQQPVGLEACLRAVRETHGHPATAPNAADDKKEGAWRMIVEAGMIAGSAFKPTTPTLANLPGSALEVEPRAHRTDLGVEDLEVTFHPCAKVYDGRYANNGWLQELPEPMTKMTWDNAALMSKATAEALGVPTVTLEGETRTVRLTSADGKRQLELPAYILPGHANGSVSLFLGYGRTAAGVVGGAPNFEAGVVGFNANLLRSSDRPDLETGVRAAGAGGSHRFSLTQEHHLIDRAGMEARSKRLGELVYETTAEQASKPGFKVAIGHAAHANEKPNPGLQIISPSDQETEQGHEGKNLSPWKEWEYKGRRWGMAIDLSKCTGCSACVVACQAENNVPIVGKEQVWRSREMHWIRIDRYFKGDVDHPEQVTSVTQPMTCQHCENAPCESVCPVAATTHSAEGLNDMVYNRCVGTRYCSNNCPYKVRRFNFFNYYKHLDKPESEVAKLVYNPEVTVRQRGVMEKCTYCVQRIQNAKIAFKAEWRKMGPRPNAAQEPLPDGTVVPACAQTCPTEAIIFGDLGQPDQPPSNVALKHQSGRAYSVLEELNTKPRTRYLAVVRNPNPKLAQAEKGNDGHGSHG